MAISRRALRFLNVSLTIVACVISPLMLAAWYAGLPAYAKLWHVFHGNSAKCGQVTVPVPYGWWAEDAGCRLVTPWPAYTLGDRTPVLMSIKLIDTVRAASAQPLTDPGYKEHTLKELRQDTDRTFDGITELSVTGLPAMCFEDGGTKSKLGPYIACNINNQIAITFFYDNPKSKADFYEILRGLQIPRLGLPPSPQASS